MPDLFTSKDEENSLSRGELESKRFDIVIVKKDGF